MKSQKLPNDVSTPFMCMATLERRNRVEELNLIGKGRVKTVRGSLESRGLSLKMIESQQLYRNGQSCDHNNSPQKIFEAFGEVAGRAPSHETQSFRCDPPIETHELYSDFEALSTTTSMHGIIGPSEVSNNSNVDIHLEPKFMTEVTTEHATKLSFEDQGMGQNRLFEVDSVRLHRMCCLKICSNKLWHLIWDKQLEVHH